MLYAEGDSVQVLLRLHDVAGDSLLERSAVGALAGEVSLPGLVVWWHPYELRDHHQLSSAAEPLQGLV